MSSIVRACAASLAAALAAPAASAQAALPTPGAALAPVHVALGQSFATWRAFTLSPLFRRAGLRCATPTRAQQLATHGKSSFMPSDCGASVTNPLGVYSPAALDVVVIDVVFHVLEGAGGQGHVTSSAIQSQIDVLNEDFRALPGTPGAAGVDTKIQFRLATVDPLGNPTSGITRTTNNTWFHDTGSYWNALAWNPARYLNIYTNNASGALGYVPFLPQTGPVGSSTDRVVLLWSTVGRNASIGPPFDQGRTATHEVAHYLGLFHTFEGGCGNAACYQSGDLICDTSPESSPHSGCDVGSTSCGSPDPVRNYLSYSDHPCMNQFTEEQARRMRCTLQFWRPQLAQPVGSTLGASYCTAAPNSTGVAARLLASGSRYVQDNDLDLLGVELPLHSNGYFLVAPTQSFVPNAGGSAGNLCVGAPTGRYRAQLASSGLQGQIGLAVDLTAVPQPTGNVAVLPGETWNFQLWYRDSLLGLATSNFSDGYTITFL